MNLFSNINIITVLVVGIFLMPILAGILLPFSSNRIQHSLLSMLNSLKFILGIILAVYLVRVILSDSGNSFLTSLYKFIPSGLFRESLAKNGAIQSMSGTGRCYDNARMEMGFV